MIKKRNVRSIIAGAALLACNPMSAQADDFDFTISAGFPFFLVVEPSYNLIEGERRIFAQYKMALDDDFAIGFEQTIDENNHHAFGVLVGALGTRSRKDRCEDDDGSSIGDAIGNAIACGLVLAFNDEAVRGVGLSYSYYFNGMDKDSWRLRFEYGYGEGQHSGNKEALGGVTIGYKF